MSVLLKDIGWLVTQDSARTVLKNTSIRIENELIAEVGSNLSSQADQIIDCQGKIVLPGLINTHTHLSMTMFRGYADDMRLQEWLESKIWPLEVNLTPEICYYGALLGCLEMIATGTTMFVDMYLLMENVAKAVKEAGLKAYLSYGIFGTEGSVLEKKSKENTKQFISYVKEMNDPRVRLAIGPHAPYSCSPELLMWAKGVAEDEGAILTTHIAETRSEQAQVQKERGMRVIEYLDKIGFLSPNLLAAHCVWLTKSEVNLMAKKKVKVSHCPVSNMKLASGGVTPVPEMLQNGVTVSLGTDGAASNNSLDMFETMKICALLQKAHRWDATVLPAQQVLDLATIEAAKALGVADKVGCIETGKQADLIVVDARAPNLVPIHGAATVISDLVYSAKGANVDTTIVAGKILMKNREFQTLKENEIYEKAQNTALSLIGNRKT
jgi:5-methylthioadenosine/S-adenosylhomocysteine deaminase